MKIVDKILNHEREGKTFFSFEFFPPRTEEGVENLFDRLDRMASFSPAFCDITWGAGGTTSDVTTDIALKMQNVICVETMMHLTCTNMPVDKLKTALEQVKKAGLQNILALRGDPPKGQEEFTVVEGGFSCALDLVKYIRAEFGDYFGIAVSGYPEAHPDTIVDDPKQMELNYWENLNYLKEKLDAGADFVVTQLFYDVDVFLKFVKDARSIGITQPILPGIMPVQTYGGFKRMTQFCKTKVPQAVLEHLEAIKDNAEAVKAYGVQLGVDMCKKLLAGGTTGLHMYTLNLEHTALAILEQLGLIDTTKAPRALPWRHVPATSQRASESVRPIFWSNRPKAYLTRTSDWDTFPSGRWGNSSSPGYGTLNDYQFMRRHSSSAKRKDKALAAWGLPTDVTGVQDVFVKYCRGDISLLPWTEIEDLHSESEEIQAQLVALNQAGYLTINSQPCVNGAKSDDPKVGWGGPGGYVYQKPYVEFFVAPEKFAALSSQLDKHATVSWLAVNAAGEQKGNMPPGDVNAVTWGVFPSREVEQPTIVDPASFLVWKDEAFELWVTEWGSLYDEGSPQRQLLQSIRDTWWLVSVVENDYVGGDLFKVFSLPEAAPAAVPVAPAAVPEAASAAAPVADAKA